MSYSNALHHKHFKHVPLHTHHATSNTFTHYKHYNQAYTPHHALNLGVTGQLAMQHPQHASVPHHPLHPPPPINLNPFPRPFFQPPFPHYPGFPAPPPINNYLAATRQEYRPKKKNSQPSHFHRAGHKQ